MGKPWRQVVTPHRDIREGRFDESVFAADLSDVAADRGPLEYRDPETFFKKTYPTQGITNLLSTVVSRLSGQGRGEAVIQIQTPFGGGKTHSLIALYHLFKHGERLKHLEAFKTVLKRNEAPSLPAARVVSFVGTAADPLKGKTPWGEIGEQVGRYELLKEHDQKRRAPGKDVLHKLLGQELTLILMDEITQYIAKAVEPDELARSQWNVEAARAYQTQVLAFMQELTETVKVLPHCSLVVTLPSSAPYGEEGERSLGQLQRIFGRVEAIYMPVEGEEVYEIIRRRLLEDPGDPQEARRVADEYWQLYQRLGDDAPSEIRQAAYRDKIRKAYPFHPELIDILFERWSTYPTFQRTRGVLRLLAEVIADLYKREHAASLIQPAHINLANASIREEFIKHIGNEYRGVVAADIADGNAKALKIDREMGSEYARFGVASGLATSIFFYSFSAGQRSGAGSPRLRVAFLRDEIPPAVVGDALRRLEDETWFLHSEGGLYFFTGQANLNRVIVQKEEEVSDDRIAEEIHARLERLAGSELRVFLYPTASNDVPDTRELKLAILVSEYAGRSAAATKFAEELVSRCGIPFRTFRNTLLILAADGREFEGLRHQVKRALALKGIREDKSVMESLSQENKQVLESKLRDAEGGINFRILAAHRHLAKVTGEKLEWLDLGLPTVGERGSLAKRVLEYLRGQEILLGKIAPRQILLKTLREDEKEKPLGEIYDAFLKFPHLPVLESDVVLQNALQEGVREGFFGVRSNNRIYFGESVPLGALDNTALLVRKELAEKEKSAVAAPAATTGVQPTPIIEGPTPTTAKPAEPSAPLARKVTHLSLRVQLPWDKLADFIRGVLRPLREDGAEIQVEVALTAHSEEGLKKSTLDHKVKETLNQIGAKILEEEQK
jgi:hypothetical protein